MASVNLARLIREPFEDTAELDEAELARVVGIGVRLMDNAIDISRFPLPGFEQCTGTCSSGTPQGRFVLTDPNTGVAWVAHVGGFVFGVVVALAIRTLGGRPGAPVDRQARPGRWGPPPPGPFGGRY